MKEAVEKKICELLKGTELDPIYVTIESVILEGRIASFKHVNSLKPIREAEVLMALSYDTDTTYALDSDGCFIWSDGGTLKWTDIDWQLGATLQEQSDETITFLHSVLCK